MVIKEEERGISLRRLKSTLAVAAMALATMESQHQGNALKDYSKERLQKVVEDPFGGFGGVVKSWNTPPHTRGHCLRCVTAAEAFVGRLQLHSVIVVGVGRMTFDRIPWVCHREKLSAHGAFADVRGNRGLGGDGGGVEGCGDGAFAHCLYHEYLPSKPACCC